MKRFLGLFSSVGLAGSCHDSAEPTPGQATSSSDGWDAGENDMEGSGQTPGSTDGTDTSGGHPDEVSTDGVGETSGNDTDGLGETSGNGTDGVGDTRASDTDGSADTGSDTEPEPCADSTSSLSITDYGATGTDTTDDTAAIASAIQAAKTQGKLVCVPSGTFYHTELVFDSVSLTGEGNTTSILYAFDPSNNTVFVRGSGVTVSHVQIKSASSGRTAVDWPLFIDHASDFTIDAILVDGGNSGGILNYGGSNGKIIRNTVQNTLADGIHTTEGAHDIIVAGNTVRNPGDDMIAMVSYGLPAVRNVLVQDNDVAENEWGRGITSIGSSDITIQGNKIGRTGCCAGILVATEEAWTSPPLSNILIRNNQLSDNSGETGHSAFLISALHSNIDRIRFEDNSITNPMHEGMKIEGDTSNVAFVDNTISDPEARGMWIVSGSNIYCSGNELNSNALSDPKCTGVDNFTVMGSSLTY